MIEIDGSQGEGGGQILRTALSLSVVTGKPFAIRQIRARRSKPGLMRQHLTAVNAAAEISGAHTEGAEVGASALVFKPGTVIPGDYLFRIGSAGSTGLVLQTVLLPLALAGDRSRVTIEGGTHNSGAPPFEFLDRCFLPLLRRMGFSLALKLKRPGFYPAGGGAIEAEIGPGAAPEPLRLLERGPLASCTAEAVIANLPAAIAERELAAVSALLDWPAERLRIRTEAQVSGPGNCLLLTIEHEHACEVVTAFGRVSASSEAVAAEAAAEARDYLSCPAPVGPHLADQLILPMALAGGGSFVTGRPSLHMLTNIDVVQRFLDTSIQVGEIGAGQWSVGVGSEEAPIAGG